MKEFLGYVRTNKVDLYSKQTIRSFLSQYSKPEVSIYRYLNRLKAIRVFYQSRDRKDLIETFKLPRPPPSFPSIPTKSELDSFYHRLTRPRDRALFLLLASSGLRLSEVLGLRRSDIEFQNRRIVPQGVHQTESTKRSFYSYYNEESERVLTEYLSTRQDSNPFVFKGIQANDYNTPETGHIANSTVETIYRKTCDGETQITPQSLREWFAEEMSERGLAERYIDFFCGRTPKSVLARHYSDFRPEKMKPRYDKAGLTVLS